MIDLDEPARFVAASNSGRLIGVPIARASWMSIRRATMQSCSLFSYLQIGGSRMAGSQTTTASQSWEMNLALFISTEQKINLLLR